MVTGKITHGKSVVAVYNIIYKTYKFNKGILKRGDIYDKINDN